MRVKVICFGEGVQYERNVYKVITLDRKEVKYLVVGATVLGTGGGGQPEVGMRILMDILERGKKLKVCTFDEVNTGCYVATPYFAGSIPAPSSRVKKTKEFSATSMVKALRFMEEVIKKKITTVIATEIGGGNTAHALHLAALLGLPLVDGDHIGRSAPELIQTSYYLNGLSLAPSVITTVNEDFLLIKEYSSIDRYEKIVRMIAEQSRAAVFIIDSPVDVGTAKKVAIVGSVSKALELGESIEKARAKGLETANIVAEELEGYVVFKGKIVDHNLREEKGFLTGHVLIEGSSENHRYSNLKVWVKNENIIAYVNDEPVALPPDLIILIGEDGYGIINSKITRRMKVTVIVAPAPKIWRSTKGLEIFGPRHFGFDLDYVPVEKLAPKV